VRWLGWAVVAWLVFRDRQPTSSDGKLSKGGPAKPSSIPGAHLAPPIAYLYRLPNELAVRLSVAQQGHGTQPIGIFDEVAKADEVIESNHWLRAWEGVRDLDAPPV
jgi:hypothetical protein